MDSMAFTGPFEGCNLPLFSGPCGCNPSAAQMNNIVNMEIINRLVNIGLSRFRWSGLPETCNERALEITLFFYGNAVFFRDPDLGFIHTPVNLVGPYNVYFESIRREAYSYNYNRTLGLDDSVLIRANRNSSPDWYTVWTYASKITNALRAIDVHTETLKRPYAIKCDEKNKQSVIAALKKIQDNDIAIIGDKFASNSVLEVLNLATNSYLDQMWGNVKNYLQQVYTAFGINNTFTSKKERLVVSESQGETNVIRHTLESELYARQTACEQINKMFGLNVSVESNQVDVFAEENAMIQLLQSGQITNEGGFGNDDTED